MSQTKAQLVGGVGISTVGDLSVYGGVNVTGVLTATSFVGGVTGDATGLTGTPNITVGFITATGASISGNVDVGGNVSIAGTLTYEDVTNVDSIGIVTARAGIILGPTANTIQLGTGTTISSPSSNTFTVLTNGSERVRVDSSGRFGVGTNGPGQLIDVQGNSNPQIKVSETNNSTSAGLFIENQGQRNWQIWADRATDTFRIGNNSRATTNLTISSTGNLGIGITNPTVEFVFSKSQNSATISEILNSNTGSSAASFLKLSSGSNYILFGVSGFGGYAANQGYGSINAIYSDYDTHFFRNSGGSSERARIQQGFSVGTSADPGVGAIYATGDITAFYSSDIRLKKDIQPISEPIKKLMEISGVTYKWNEEYLKDKDVDGYFVRETEVGVIAQDVEKVLPEVVATRENGYKAVRYEKLVALLIEAVKDQQKQIDELKARLEEV